MKTTRIPLRRAASIKSLMQIKDVTEEDAKAIRAIWHTDRYRGRARPAIGKLLGTHGLEYLGRTKRTRHEVYYCNAGDTYATTILFVGPHLRVGCWGDMVERGTVATDPGY